MEEKDFSSRKLYIKLLIPIIIGVGVIVWLFRSEFGDASFDSVDFGWKQVLCIALALVFVVGKDFGLTWRFHTIAAPDLPWSRAVRVDLMCAFTSAITPSAVGGSALAIFYLNREGVQAGRAATLTFTTLLLDELFFVIFCPIIVLVLPFDQIFGGPGKGAFLEGVELTFWLVYAGIVIWTLILFFGIFINPGFIRRVALRLFYFRLLRKWFPVMKESMDNMVKTSGWIKQRSFKWWLNVFGATVLSWFSRYFIVNALFIGFVPWCSPLLVFARQFVVWVILMISPTPGGSGISEWMFTEYYGDLIGSGEIAVVIALIWRIITYYIYLAIGLCLIPSYFGRKKKKALTST